MPIEKGQDWGWPGELPAEAPVFSSDAEAAHYVQAEMAKSGAGAANPPILGLDGGDLARTLGVRHPYQRVGPKFLLPIDAIRVRLESDEEYLCIAHVVVGDLLISSSATALMNAAFIGPLNVAPRAHPGDGRIDTVRLQLGLVDRFRAKRRMITGAHVPHPGISTTRTGEVTLEYDRPQSAKIDGRRIGRVRSIKAAIVANAFTVAV